VVGDGDGAVGGRVPGDRFALGGHLAAAPHDVGLADGLAVELGESDDDALVDVWFDALSDAPLAAADVDEVALGAGLDDEDELGGALHDDDGFEVDDPEELGADELDDVELVRPELLGLELLGRELLALEFGALLDERGAEDDAGLCPAALLLPECRDDEEPDGCDVPSVAGSTGITAGVPVA
jgi:hypothetical protein